MAIKNYTSKVKPADSLGNIQTLLSEHGAERVMIDYDNGKPTALVFQMTVGVNKVNFRLTVDPEGMLRAMRRDKKVKKGSCNMEQAERTAWKNKHEWLHLQLTEIEAEQATIEQLLLGYAVMPTGETFHEYMKDNELQLTN